jgi:hypothetical protein
MDSPFRFLLTSFILTTFFSCNLNLDKETTIFNPENIIINDILLSEFADNIIYIPIDNEIIFQHPNRIETTEELFIMATFPTGIMVFDRQGKFCNKIGSRGRGPGEYRSGLLFTIDRDNELIYILEQKKIIVYTFQGLVKTEFSIDKFDSYFTDIHYQSGKLYLAGFRESGFAKYDWLVIDTSGNLISCKKNNVPGFLTGWGAHGGFFLNDDELHYWNSYNDTIFVIQDSIHHPYMYIAQGDFREPRENYPLEDAMKYFKIFNIICSQKYLFLRYSFDKLLHEACIDKENGMHMLFGKSKGLYFDYPGIKNNFDGGPNFSPFSYYNRNNDEYLIGWTYAYRIIAHVKSEAFRNSTPKFPEKKQELEKLAASLDENGNPVLMLVKLKK